jgi:putative redox protein
MVVASAKWTAQMHFEGRASHPVIMDADPNGGNSPMELVLIALCGCTAFDVASVLQKKREPFTSIQVTAEAEEAILPPRVFTDIRVVYRVGGKVSATAVERAVYLSEEKYCSVAAMLKKTAKITYRIELDQK